MKKCLLPKIRFPEFVKDGEWKKVCLEDCLVQKLEYGVNKAAVPYSSDLPTYLRITDITDDGTFANENKVSVDVEVTQKNSLKEGDIVLARTGASVGKAYKYRIEDGPLVYAGFLIRVRPDAKKLKSDYLFQYLFSNDYKKWVASKCLRCAQPGINAAEYSSLEIPCPPTIEEQQKIADFLSSVDVMIAAVQKEIEMLREQKRGMLQKLFPRNGKNIPDYRFPDFKNDREWQNGCLGDFASFFKGKGISKSEISDDGNIPCIRYGELYTRYHEMVKNVKSHTVLSPENLFFSQKNDVIIPATGETAEDSLPGAAYCQRADISLCAGNHDRSV